MPGLPIGFKEFVKNPVVAVLYICLLAIGGLYIDLRHETHVSNAEKTKQISEMQSTIAHLTVSVDLLKVQLQRADSTVADMTATFRVLKQLGKIQ